MGSVVHRVEYIEVSAKEQIEQVSVLFKKLLTNITYNPELALKISKAPPKKSFLAPSSLPAKSARPLRRPKKQEKILDPEQDSNLNIKRNFEQEDSPQKSQRSGIKLKKQVEMVDRKEIC